MRYIMERLEQIIIELSSGESTDAIKDDLPATLEQYADEKEKIRLRMMEEVFNAGEEKAIFLVIDKYQSVYTRLMDKLYHFQKKIKKSDNRYAAAKSLFDHLEELLMFLQVHYNKYFNLQQKMPAVKIEKAGEEFQQKTRCMEVYLKKTAVPDHLHRLIIEPLENLVKSKIINYEEAQYANLIAATLPGIDPISEGIGNIIRKKLVSLDYNSPRICAYYINELDQLTSSQDSVQAKLHLLKFHLKTINQIIIHPGNILHPGLPGLKVQLVNWLNEEIYFYTMEQSLLAAQTQGSASEVKIHTALSVPQLALLFRLLKEEQLITNANQSELLKVVAANFTTLQKEHFSYGHLHGKYYKIEASTKRSLYDILMRLVHLSRKIG